MGLNKKRKDEDDISVSEEGKADVHSEEDRKESMDLEGGDEEEFDNVMGTDRSLEVNGHYDRAERNRNNGRYLETENEMNPNNQESSSRELRSKDTDDEKDKKKKDKKKKRKVYKTPIEDLWYFARVWRALQPRYCHH